MQCFAIVPGGRCLLQITSDDACARTWQGYCTSSRSCKTFAVVLASFGSALEAPTDVAALGDLAAYMQPLCGLPACLAADGAHGPISSWFWDGWTPDMPGLLHSLLLIF